MGGAHDQQPAVGEARRSTAAASNGAPPHASPSRCTPPRATARDGEDATGARGDQGGIGGGERSTGTGATNDAASTPGDASIYICVRDTNS